MGLWGFFFFVKIALYFKGILHLDIAWNLAFAAFLLVPVPGKLKKSALFEFFHGVVNVIAAILLVWHDSWFPPLLDTIKFVQQQGLPEKEYILVFITRYYDEHLIVLAVVAFLVCLLLDRLIKLVPVAMVCIALLIPYNLYQKPDSTELNANLDGFFDNEQTRTVHFKKPEKGALDFDVIFLHVCSLAWDDLRVVGQEHHPLFARFNYLYTNFNTATAYSGPAMIRLHKMNCGQPSHDSIYEDVPSECYIMQTLDWIGFKPYAVLNHNGQYGDFAKEMVRYAKFEEKPMSLDGVPVKQEMFDGSPLTDDYETLDAWWNRRIASGEKAAALYYNTVSLHDGSHWANDKKWFKRDRKVMYREFIDKMFNDYERFLSLIEASGRNAIVVFIPEHGMALEGTQIQAAGLRDTPLPHITYVPVGIKLIGPKFKNEALRQVQITKPTSYLAVAHQLSYFIKENVFYKDTVLPRRMMEDLPATEYVAENQGVKVMKGSEDKVYFYGKEKEWMEMDKNMIR